MVGNDVPVREILFALARESKLNIDIHPGITGNVTVNAVDQTLPAILERISKQVDLRYKVEGNTLSITPDMPTLRTYRVNYVNMDRDTTSSIGVAAQIASTGVAASTAGSSASSDSSGSSNNSNTMVNSKSKNNFWDSMAENIRIILKSTKTQAASAEERAARAEAVRNAQEDRLKQVEAVSRAGAGAEKLFQEAFKSQPANFESKEDVIVNPVAGTVTVMATERQHGFIQQYLDVVMASVLRQVLIETTIVEVTLGDSYQLGIDWSVVAGDFTFVQSLGTSGTVRPLPGQTGNAFVATYSGNNDKAAIRALETFGNARVLSSPKLMALNNQTAILKVVDNLVYFTIEAQVAAGNTNSNNLIAYTTTPHTIPVGVVMSMTPQISDNGAVTLNVRPTISRKVGEVQDPNPSLSQGVGRTVTSTIPEIEVREMESVLQVDSGQSVVLGGLMQDQVAKKTDGVPGLSKLPLIGKLFQGKENFATKTELVIFLRPTVIRRPSLNTEELKNFKQFLPEELPPLTTDESFN
ncbi:MAG TPA: pilus (MSHA type) biogenesis protein MshL [Methylophilaceae bacterium]|nr:pilus (MSHA type) biogenesis protein MshL [Methylophilaceae bacterium]